MEFTENKGERRKSRKRRNLTHIERQKKTENGTERS